MKRICSLLLAVMLGALCVSAAAAETAPVSIRELPGVTSPRWKQTYEAYGRTIDVDVDITIPEAEKAPVLKVRRAEPLADPLKSELAEEYRKADQKDKKHYYDFESTDYNTISLEHKFPILYGTSKKKDNLDGVTGEMHDLPRYDGNQAYAEDNPMTVNEAAEIIRTRLKEVLPEVEIRMDTVVVNGKTFWRKSKKPVYNKGFYTLNMTQCFHGIPYMASIYEDYLDTEDSIWPHWRDPELWAERVWNSHHGRLMGYVFSEDSWFFTGRFYRETGQVLDDIPLLPFDAVKDQVEALIQSGHVRWINSVTLGYVHFETEDTKEFILLPCWVVWCEYHPDGSESEKTFGINDSELMFINGDYYRPIIINAQTGELYDPHSTAEGRIMCPDLSAWQ